MRSSLISSKRLQRILLLIGTLISYILFNNLDTSVIAAIVFLTIPSTVVLLQILQSKRDSKFAIFVFPNFWLLVSILFIFFLPPFLYLTTPDFSNFPFLGRGWEKTYGSTIILGSVALFGIALSNNHDKHLTQRKSKFIKKNYEIQNALVIAFLSYGLIGYSIWLRNQGGFVSIFSNRIQLQQNLVQFNNGYLYDSLLVVTGVMTALLSNKRFKGNKKFNWIEVCIILTMLPYLARGDRSVFLFTLTVVLIIYSLTSEQNSRKFHRYVIAIALIPMLVVTPRIYRHSESVSLSLFFQGYSIQNITETLTGLDTAMVPALAILRSELGSEINYQYGKSYLLSIGKPIPRSIWKEKPIEIDRLLNQELFPATSKQVGFSFIGVSEPLVNFGFFGVLVFFFLIGRINENIVRYDKELTQKRILLIAWTAGFMYILIRGNLTTDLQRLLFPLIPGILCLKSIKNDF